MTYDKSMRRRLLRVFGLAPAVLLTTAAVGAHAADKSKSGDQGAAEAAVEKFLATIEKGFRTRNPEMLSSPDIYYTDDDSADHYVLYDVIPPFVDIGAKNLLDKNKKYVEATEGPTIASWKDKRIGGGGPYAYFHGIMHATGKYKDGRQLDLTFRHTLVFKKINGKYLCIHEHASLPYEAMAIDAPKPKA